MLAPSISGSVMTSWKGLRSWGSSDTNSSIPNCSYDTCSYIFLNTASKPFPITLGNYWGHNASILEGSVKGDACYRDEPVIWESALIRSFAVLHWSIMHKKSLISLFSLSSECASNFSKFPISASACSKLGSSPWRKCKNGASLHLFLLRCIHALPRTYDLGWSGSRNVQ